MATISASGEGAITQTIHVDRDESAQNLSPAQFVDFYEIDRTVVAIQTGAYKRTALQFPDELLHDSVPIYRLLRARLAAEHELYVLADTSYGSCCVDEVAAQHVDADAMVHYGHACMSKTSRLPVIYVFGKKSLDVDDCASKLMSSLGSDGVEGQGVKNVILKHEVAFTHLADSLKSSMQARLPSDCELHYDPPPTSTEPAQSATTGSTSPLDPKDTELENCSIFFIGPETLTLNNLLMTHSSIPIHSYDPQTKSARVESLRANKMLMRRYGAVQKARDADVFGILVGTLGVASYLPMISHIRSLIAKAKKKSYTISVGKLNPAKLANFMEIECFVNVACPENSVIEAKEFLRPIITPFELEIALKSEPTWSGRYVLDFAQLLQEVGHEDGPPETRDKSDDDPDRPEFSLITGKYRQARRYGEVDEVDDAAEGDAEAENNPNAVVVRNKDGTLAKVSASAAGQFLASRSYTGLDMRAGMDAPGVLEQGRSGIARGYADDQKHGLSNDI